MTSRYLEIHPKDPQLRLIRQAVEIIREGGVVVYPTDSCYALGCHIGDKAAMERISRIRQTDKPSPLHVGVQRPVRDRQLRARRATRSTAPSRRSRPGRTPSSCRRPRRRRGACRTRSARPSASACPTIPVPIAILDELGEPIMSSTLILPGDEHPLTDAREIQERPVPLRRCGDRQRQLRPRARAA